MVWDINAPQGNESGKIKWEIVKWTRGTGLDLGCGMQKTFPHFIGVDSGKDGLLFGHPINPDVRVATAARLPMFASGSLDFVFSSHVLEHFPLKTEHIRQLAQTHRMVDENTAAQALAEWMRVIKVDGYLVLYVPDEEAYPKVGEEGANPDHCFNCNYETVLQLMRETCTAWDLVDFQTRHGGQEYSLFFVFQKKNSKQRTSWESKPKPLPAIEPGSLEEVTAPPQMSCGLVRYGAYGDLLQCSSVAAGLKKQGYHVTLYTSPPGHEVIQHDPNIDELYLQDKDQVPNQYLGQFWAYQSKKYAKWVNLSESVESTLLAQPGRSVHGFSPAARHALMNHNYLEMQHLIADVPHEPAVAFYPTETEAAWARKERTKLLYGRSAHDAFNLQGRLIMWSLAGSSVHKTWGGLDQAIARILVTFPAAHVVFVGAADCRILETGWEKEPRVHCRSGEYSIRQSLALLQVCDVVIGPETGVLNAAACMEIPKVLFLSHSTHENLSRDWKGYVMALASRDTHCPGRGKNAAPACHQLHYNWDHCRMYGEQGDPMWGTAQCQADLPFEGVWDAIRWAIGATYPQLANLTKSEGEVAGEALQRLKATCDRNVNERVDRQIMKLAGEP